MKGSKLWMLALAPLVLAACGANDTDAEEDDPLDGEAPAAATTDPAVATVPADTAAGGMAGHNQVAMTPVGGSGVSGTAMLAEQGSATQVMVTLAGTSGTGVHQGHVHQGTCESPGQVVAPLEPVTADGGGGGTATSTVQIPTATLMNGQHIVLYHEAGGSPGAPVVCGAVPGHAM